MRYLNTPRRYAQKISVSSYPFGSTMSGRVFSGDGYRFGFNNQEKDSELGDAYAFEYRIHDARLGRFLSVDPLAMDYAWNSVFAFAENRVILMIDLEGKEGFYPSPSYELWTAAGVTQASADQLCRNVEQTFKTIAKYSGPALAVIGGVLTVGVVAAVGTASVTFSIVGTLSGSMAIAGGVAQETAVIAGREELVNKIPTSYFGGLALSVELTIGTENRVFSGIVSFVEGIYTWQPADLKAFETGLTSAGYSVDAINAIKGGFELGSDLSTAIQSAIDKYNNSSNVPNGATAEEIQSTENKDTDAANTNPLLNKIAIPKPISCHTEPEITLPSQSTTKPSVSQITWPRPTTGTTSPKTTSIPKEEIKEILEFLKSMPTTDPGGSSSSKTK